jgi:Uma2 family endonuclease
MTTVHVYSDSVHVPAWVTDLESFRRWMHSDESPENVTVFYLRGDVWVDMSKEQLFSHVSVKGEFTRVLANLTKELRLGRIFPDGLLLTNEDADVSGNPDATFISNATFRDERVRLIEGAEEGFVELEGSPDMVLEVVSDSSVEKDTEVLRELYWKAGIREYWLVDARGERVDFQILRHTSRGFSSVRKSGGWLKSNVFGKSFRLTRAIDDVGQPDFTLEVQ